MKAAFITSSVFGLVSLAVSSVYASPIAVTPETGSGSETIKMEKRQGPFSGDGTYYETGLGACGWYNSDTDYIAAVGAGYFDSYPGATANPNDNPICGRQITAQYGGNQVSVSIVDRCAGCAGAYDLDFSPSAFSQLADQSVGRLTGVQWSFD